MATTWKKGKKSKSLALDWVATGNINLTEIRLGFKIPNNLVGSFTIKQCLPNSCYYNQASYIEGGLYYKLNITFPFYHFLRLTGHMVGKVGKAVAAGIGGTILLINVCRKRKIFYSFWKLLKMYSVPSRFIRDRLCVFNPLSAKIFTIFG